MAEWQNGRMAEWQNGRMAEWQILLIRLHCHKTIILARTTLGKKKYPRPSIEFIDNFRKC